MGADELRAVLPLIVLAAGAVLLVLVIAFRRDHALAASISLAVFALTFASALILTGSGSTNATVLLKVDEYARFFIGLLASGGFAVAAFSYDYLEKKEGRHEEFYILLIIATMGASVLVCANHFASFFLALETMTISLYAMIALLRESEYSLEAGVKYLVLAAVASAFLLFGMALVYAETGVMGFRELAALVPHALGSVSLAGFAMIIVGAGFKLAVVPFHMWTPDVYEGAPAPVAGYVATVSKGSVFALLLRLFNSVDVRGFAPLFDSVYAIAILSMLFGNLLALRQNNIKRILAYSSIANLGYLLVAFLAGGRPAATASSFFLVSYFITMLGAFGVVSALSGRERDLEDISQLRGLAIHSPFIAGLFSAMLLSLAGIPLTAGFVAKFYVAAAGVGRSLWGLVIVLALTSAIGLYYYLRIISAMYMRIPERGERAEAVRGAVSLATGVLLFLLLLLLVWFGVYPSPLLRAVEGAAASLI
jgi:NADH-quinone oxidoreductase subunit N